MKRPAKASNSLKNGVARVMLTNSVNESIPMPPNLGCHAVNGAG